MKVRFTMLLGVVVVFLLVAILVGTFFLNQDGCDLGMFTCSEGSVCVPQRALCNAYDDCPDGEDESNSVCGDFHGSSFMVDLFQNATFNASYQNCEQEDVPEGCFCINQFWVNCKELNLTSVPTTIRGNMTRLILANNSIHEIAEGAFDSYSLELIHLEGNGIISLPKNIFQSQKNLIKLLLLRNQIEAIDDEMFAGLQNLTILYMQHNRIKYLAENAFRDLPSLRFLDLSGNQLNLKEGFPLVPSISDLLVDSNKVAYLNESHFRNVSSVIYLGLSDNLINEIHPKSFHGLKELEELDLSHNYIKTLPPVIFRDNSLLSRLLLDNNPLLTISSELFTGLQNLASLHLREIEIHNISPSIFSGLKKLKNISFKKYYYCTFVPFVRKCQPRTDGLSTFENLLGRKLLGVYVWIVGAATFFGNSFVVWRRRSPRDENKSLSLLVRNLAASDFLMCIYLTIIGWKDVQYRGIYHQVSHSWLVSWTCSFAGAVGMLSSEVSIMILVLISLERFLLIALPFSGHKLLTVKSAYSILSVIWFFGAFIAIFPIFIYRNSTRFYGTNGMCFPLHLEDPFFQGWQVSAFIFLFFNSLGMFILAALYAGMLISVWHTRRATNTVNYRDFEFAVRFFFIVLTNTACWLPIVVLKIMALNRIYLTADVYAWIAVVIIPVNSAFNPFLYTVTTPRYREMIAKAFLRRGRTLWRTKRVASTDTSSSNTTQRRVHLSSTDMTGISLEEFSQPKDIQLGENDNFTCAFPETVLTEEPSKKDVLYNDVYM